MQKFNLVVVRPVSGKKGEFLFSVTKHAENVSEAVKAARKDIEGSGWVVLQSASYHSDEPECNQMAWALADAYTNKFGPLALNGTSGSDGVVA